MKPTIEFFVKLLDDKNQETNHFKLGSSLDVAICEEYYNELGFKGSKNKYALLVGPRSSITVWVNSLSIPATIKMGEPDSIFLHQDIKGFFSDNERVFLINFYDYMNYYFNKQHSIKVSRIVRTNLNDAIALKIPMKYRRLGYIPGQYFFGIKRESNQIFKFEMIGYSRERFEISNKRRDIDFIEFFIAPNKFYEYINHLIAQKRIIVNKSIGRKILTEAINLKESYARKVFSYFKDKGKFPTPIELVSDEIGIPLGFEKVILDYIFNKIEVDPKTLSSSEKDNLERDARKILAFTSKKLKQVEKSDWKANMPLISDVVLDLKLNIEDVKKVYAYINSNNFLISPSEDALISKKAKTIVNLIQKTEEIPSIYDLIAKGLEVHEIKKALIQLEPLLKNQYKEIDLMIPQIRYPVDASLTDYQEFVEEDLTPLSSVTAKIQAPIKENGEILPLETQIDNAKFERSNEEPVKFIGSPDILLKTIRAHIEHEAAFSKINEKIAIENELYFGNLIYAYLGKSKKIVHFSVEVKITGDVNTLSGKITLKVKSNDLSLSDRFYQIFQARTEEAIQKVSHDQLIADSTHLFQVTEHAGKNWISPDELVLRYGFSEERAIRTLEYMVENKQIIKEKRVSTGTRYYFPSLAEK
ncbi:MAG: hypothetical protein EAX96_12130 [Candidatus Lokiarchaeota archaeon]|nr:hypothetical protein [Candidatus Lokiarchaeota archaeon]